MVVLAWRKSKISLLVIVLLSASHTKQLMSVSLWIIHILKRIFSARSLPPHNVTFLPQSPFHLFSSNPNRQHLTKENADKRNVSPYCPTHVVMFYPHSTDAWKDTSPNPRLNADDSLRWLIAPYGWHGFIGAVCFAVKKNETDVAHCEMLNI